MNVNFLTQQQQKNLSECNEANNNIRFVNWCATEEQLSGGHLYVYFNNKLYRHTHINDLIHAQTEALLPIYTFHIFHSIFSKIIHFFGTNISDIITTR